MTILEALQERNTAEVSRLLDEVEDINGLDERGWTLLNWAAGQGHLPLVAMIVERGANLLTRGRDNRTPYLIALAAGHLDTVKYLKEA